LRAVAVLAVVGFHAFPLSVTGGFVGVDVFFVISGFLISTIIFGRLERNAFSFTEFYGQRIRRIFPALLLILIACYSFGWLALLADEYKQLGKHIAAGAGFISNFVLWSESGYFENAAETKPLLHLWSLGIEEQFYVVWPLLLWAAWRMGFNLLTVTLLVAFASFVLNITETGKDAVAAFYSPQTRFWELLAGSLLAWFSLYKKLEFPKLEHKLDCWLRAAGYSCTSEASGMSLLRNAQSIVGVVLIAIALLTITKREESFPGWALLPTLGTVLVISAGAQAWANRVLLSNRALVGLGLISYPLYLWHWPLLSFARIIEGETVAGSIRIAAVLISVALAWLTYELVEKQIRFGKFKNAKIFTLVAAMIISGCVGYDAYKRDGLRFRKNATSKRYEGDTGHVDFHKYIADGYFPCTPDEIARKALDYEGYVRCMQSKDNSNVEIALIGDSHAEHLFIGIAEALPNKNIAFYIRASAPFVGNDDFSTIYKHVISSKSLRTVILTMAWARKIDEGLPVSTMENEILKTARLLIESGKDVYISDGVPAFKFAPEICKGRWLSTKIPNCEVTQKNESRSDLVALQNVVSKDSRIKLLKTRKYLCSEDACSMVKDGKLLYRDTHHLNINGSKYVGRRIVEDNPGLRQ
jgi:peptidoglycan/LPS O-acetylase OafA/YrhL